MEKDQQSMASELHGSEGNRGSPPPPEFYTFHIKVLVLFCVEAQSLLQPCMVKMEQILDTILLLLLPLVVCLSALHTEREGEGLYNISLDTEMK